MFDTPLLIVTYMLIFPEDKNLSLVHSINYILTMIWFTNGIIHYNAIIRYIT